jgi:hypothetical protein
MEKKNNSRVKQQYILGGDLLATPQPLFPFSSFLPTTFFKRLILIVLFSYASAII